MVFARKLIKEPNLRFLYEDLNRCFPNATMVLVVRDPRDNLRSFLNGFHLPGHLDTLDAEHRNGLNPVWQAIVLNQGLHIEATNYVDGLAGRWNRAVDVYLNHTDEVHLIRYEDFCSNKTEAIEDLVEDIGLKPKYDVGAVVNQQYQGRGNRKVDWEEFFGPSNLPTIEKRCRNRMKKN